MDSEDPRLHLNLPLAGKNRGLLHSTILQGMTGCLRRFPANISFSNSLKPLSPSASNDDGTEADYPPLTAPVAPIGASIAPFRTSKTAPILFYEKNNPFYEFTNFSPHGVIYKGKKYPTSEHLFQALKVRVSNFSLVGTDTISYTMVSMALCLVPR